MAQQRPEDRDTLQGFLFALAAYFLWGFLPFYMKAVAHIPAQEVVAHRAIWSVPVAGAVLVWLGRTADLRRAITHWPTLRMAMLTACLIAVNWGIYVWAIGNGRALETALGYYINPLFSVFLGAVLLKESLSRLQLVAIALAVTGVSILTWQAGGLPLISIGLSLSWGFYAFFRRTVAIGPNQGFLLEVLLLAPIGIAYVLWLTVSGNGHFLAGSSYDTWMLMAAGIVTAVPLIAYANGAKLLRLSTIGIMQYIAPTMIFLIAIFIFREPFDLGRLVAFGFIWAALVAYSWPMIQALRRSRRAEAAGT